MTDAFNGDNYGAAALVSYVERIEELHEQRDRLGRQVADILAEAKEDGFDVKALRQVLRERRIDPVKRNEHYAVMQEYRNQLDMFDAPPKANGPARRRVTGDDLVGDEMPGIA